MSTNIDAASLNEAADALEAEYMAVFSGQKKAAKIALEPIVRAIKLLRTLATPAIQAEAVRPDDELASMTRMFHDACADLGVIHEALGLDHDEAGGAAPILEAIEELKRTATSKPSGDRFEFEHAGTTHTLFGERAAINALVQWRKRQEKITNHALSRRNPKD